MDSTKVIDQLNAHMGIPAGIRFEAGEGGLVRAAITAGGATAHVYLHGAHVTHFQPAGQEPLIFMSKASRFESGKPIRGGVPVCFPWFGAKADDPKAAAHGFVRDRNWKFKTVEKQPDGSINVTLILKWSPRTLELWPHHFSATYSVTLHGDGQRLSLELTAKNLNPSDGEPITFEAALHTYLLIGDIHQARVTGLNNVEYIDKVDSFTRKRQQDAITFTGETDRVYLSTTAACEVTDPAMKRRIRIEKSGSNTTVVWNPWINKAKAMADFGDDEWPNMMCIETANAGENAVTIQPKKSHAMKTVISCAAM
ncbi:MAG: D-hexose-6-phosphate mutarotase [Phycisphaeraceae bacterium]